MDALDRLRTRVYLGCLISVAYGLMGGERIELSYLSVPHFECGASTNSAIRPR
jgi:hypothetical protein